MNINEYRKKYLELEQKAAQAKQDFEIFKIGEKCNFNNLYYEEQKEHLNWFVKHFDYIERHKEYIKKSPILSKIVIDFMCLYRGGGLISGAGFSIASGGYKIFLGNLLDVWDAGFCYEGYPIVHCEFGIHWGTTYIIKYIKNNTIETVEKKYDGHQWYVPEIGEEVFNLLKKFNINKQFPDMSTYRTIELIKCTLKTENEQ